jgi:hypothetical protein
VIAAAEAEVAAAIAQPPAYAPGEVSGLADLALTAGVARSLPVTQRIELARDYVRRGLDAGDIEGNRAQALDGCTVLASGLPDPVRHELFDRILPIAQGDIQRSSFDEMTDELTHPLGSFQMKLGTGELRRAAVTACATLAADSERAVRAWDAAQHLLRSNNPLDLSAVARVAYALALNGFGGPIPWAVLASSGDRRLRQAAAALLAKEQDINGPLARDLAQDPEAPVRRELASALLQFADRNPGLAKSLATILANDARFSVRTRVAATLLDPGDS